MEQLTKSEKIELGTKEIAKRIRKQLKQEFPNCKFSVTIERYAGGSSISINLMEAPFKVIKDFEEISEKALFEYTEMRNSSTKRRIERTQAKKYHQLNKYTLKEDYDPQTWNNGVFITEKAYKVLRKAVEIAEKYNFNDSDLMTDYYAVNFTLHICIGKFNKEFKRV